MKKVLKTLLILSLAVLFAMSLVACGDKGGNKSADGGIKYKKIDGVYTIYKYVAEEGKSVINLGEELGDDVTDVRIKKGAFKGNDTLKKIIVSNKITQIDKGAFEGMKSLESLEVCFIGKTANADVYPNQSQAQVDKAVDSERTIAHFFGDTDYSVGVPVKISYNSSSSTTCYMPITLKEIVVNTQDEYSIPMYAFNGAVNLTSIKLIGNITAIGEYAFGGCKELKAIELPSSVNTIYDGAFINCAKLATLTVDANASLIVKKDAFVGTKINRNALDGNISGIDENMRDEIFGKAE
ncbi:MAG: leucine-rich repeat protein [Clostridia bacterium]|nr:leucine-rich repeat protein [Clostridia bacterium]